MNPPRFIRFTPAFQPGDVFVRADAVTYVDKFHPSNAGLMGLPKGANDATVIGTGGYGISYVKESPAQVIEALRASEPTGTVSIEIVVPDGDTSSLMDDCACNCGMTCCDDEPDAADYALALKEAQDDAKIADERAEWYKKLADRAQQLLAAEAKRSDLLRGERDMAQREAAYHQWLATSLLDLLGQKQAELDHYAKEVGTEVAKNAKLHEERDTFLAKLKDTTAALEKANCELNAARYGAFWRGDNGNSAGFPKPD